MAGQQYIGTGRIGPSDNTKAYTGTAGTYGPVGTETYKVRVMCTTDAYVTTDGTTPSSTNGAYMPSMQVEVFTVTPGQSVKAVQVSSAGTLCVTEFI